MISVQIIHKLCFALLIIFISAPDLDFNNILFSSIVDNNICAFAVAGLRFNIIISDTIDDWFQV